VAILLNVSSTMLRIRASGAPGLVLILEMLRVMPAMHLKLQIKALFVDFTKSDAHLDVQIGQLCAPTPLNPNAGYSVNPLGILKNYDICW
jgi:hypothetical protein